MKASCLSKWSLKRKRKVVKDEDELSTSSTNDVCLREGFQEEKKKFISLEGAFNKEEES